MVSLVLKFLKSWHDVPIPMTTSALVEDCMSLTVANLPVVATASFRHLKSSSDDDGDGQRWSAWKFKTRTMPVSTATHFTSGVSRSAAAGDAGTATELTSSAIMDQSKGSVSVGMGAYSLGSVGADELFADGTKSVDASTPVRREEKAGIVRIDVLPYEREQPPLPPRP
ncbi:hypothetical protein EI94DRAFT_1726212 [Lactarius quietus]|nr:hypothetical protein EI94DRAFT_1726212 [Lactarius quietus]